MSWSRRSPSVVATIYLVGLLVTLGACRAPLDFDEEGLFVEVFMSVAGPGRLEATDPGSNKVEVCISRFGASTTACKSWKFLDAGGGGAFPVIAVPDAGAVLQSWPLGCPDSTSLTCVLFFSSTPAFLHYEAVFVLKGIVLEDDFEDPRGCGQWTVADLGGSNSSGSVDCLGSGGINGSAYREMTHTFTAAGNLFLEHSFTGDSLVVGDGGGTETCAATVRFQEQRRVTSAAFLGAAVGAWVWIKQDGVRFNGPTSTFSHLDWDGYDSEPLTAADFSPGLDLCPATASTLTFGFGRSNTTGGVITMVHGIDDWSVTIQPAP